MKRLAVIALLGACTSDVDPPWQLDHDRVIAVRANPPRIASGEVSMITGLIGTKGNAPAENSPSTTEVVSPAALRSTLTGSFLRAPDEAQLAAARTELGLDPGDPVPVRVRTTFDFVSPTLVGLKVVWMGEHRDNPALGPITVNGIDATTSDQLHVPSETDVPLEVMFDDTHVVNWLTSAGEMHDFDLPAAYLRIEPETPHEGMLGVVVRDELGGVAWKLWAISSP